MCLGLRTNKQQEDKPELTFANSDIAKDFVGKSTFSEKSLKDSGISS